MVAFVVRDPQMASLIVSNGCLIAAALLLMRLLRLDYDELICRRAVTFLLFNPVSFFLSAAYPESTFLLLAVGALLAARRGQWLGAGICGALLSATRPPGLMIGVPLLVEHATQWWEQGEPRRRLLQSRLLWLGLIPLGIGAYLANTSLWYYWLLYFILAVAFTYFYAYIVWQQQNIPESLQKQGSFIPGYRPGEPTGKYLNAILNRVTLAGALFLGIVAILPYLSRVGGNQLLSSASLLIVVGVMLDTVRQLEAQIVMRNYSGFLS